MIVVDIVVTRISLFTFGTRFAMGARFAPQAPVIIVGIVTTFTTKVVGAQAPKIGGRCIRECKTGKFIGTRRFFSAAIARMQAGHTAQTARNRESGFGFRFGDTGAAFAGGAGTLGPGVIGVGMQLGDGECLPWEN